VKQFAQKICLFLFFTALFSGRSNELATVTGAITGTVLFWPLYRKLLPASVKRIRHKVPVETEPEEVAAE